MISRTFDTTNLGQIKTVYPSAYLFRQEKGLLSGGIKTHGHQLTIEPCLSSNGQKPYHSVTFNLLWCSYTNIYFKNYRHKYYINNIIVSYIFIFMFLFILCHNICILNLKSIIKLLIIISSVPRFVCMFIDIEVSIS